MSLRFAFCVDLEGIKRGRKGVKIMSISFELRKNIHSIRVRRIGDFEVYFEKEQFFVKILF